jgi:hypothetical protein
MLKERFRKAPTFPGTQKIHRVIHDSKNQVQTEVFPEVNVFNTAYMGYLHDEEYWRIRK